MAIDTAAKRRSAGGVPFLPLGPGVTPDAAKPVAWRQQSGWGYSGIEAGAPVVSTSRLVCGSASLVARVSGTAIVEERVSGTASIVARVSGTASIEEC